MTENTNEQGRQRPWVGFARDYSLVTVHMDWYRNNRNERVIAMKDDALRFIFDITETGSQSAASSGELLHDVRTEYETAVLILEVITDSGPEFANGHKYDHPCLDRSSNSTCTTRTSNTRSARWIHHRTMVKSTILSDLRTKRWGFDTLDEFLHFYN